MRETVVGLSVLKDKRYVHPWDQSVFSRENSIAYEDRTAFSVMGRVGTGPFSLLGEYLYYDYPIPDRDDPANCSVNVKGTGFSVFPMLRVTEQFDIVAVLADTQASQAFKSYLKTGCDTRSYTGFSILPEGHITEMDAITIFTEG